MGDNTSWQRLWTRDNILISVVPSRSEDELRTTKVTDRSNYTLLTKAQHKDEDDDESVDKFKTDEPVETNATEIAIETKVVKAEEELYKPYKTNSIENRIETKNIKPKTEKAKSFSLEKKFNIEVDAEDDPKPHKNMKQKNTKVNICLSKGRPQRNVRMLVLFIQ